MEELSKRRLVVGTGPGWQESQHKKDGWIGLDIIPEFNPDYVRDITKGLPFDNNSIDEILTEHVLEHIEHKDGDFVMSEIQRVLKPNGIVTIEVPYWRDDIAVESAGHIRFFSPNSFMNYYENPFYKEMGQCHFSQVVSNQLIESGRSGETPARVIRITLKK